MVWFKSLGDEWLVKDGDVLDRFAEDYVNSDTMNSEKFETRLDRYLSKQPTTKGQNASLPDSRAE